MSHHVNLTLDSAWVLEVGALPIAALRDRLLDRLELDSVDDTRDVGAALADAFMEGARQASVELGAQLIGQGVKLTTDIGPPEPTS